MNYRLIIAGIAGGFAGFLYWYFAGCLSGTCPLQSNPIFDIIYGILLGVFIFEFFKKKKKNGTEKNIGIE